MKHSRKLLFLVIFSFSNPYSYATILDQAAIDKKALAIEKKLTRDRYVMYGLTTMAITYGIYQWMPLLMNVVSSKPAPASEKSATKEQKTAEQRSLSESFKAGIQSFTSGTYDLFHTLFCTKESWLSMLQFMLSVSGAGIIDQVNAQFIHTDTLRWYIHAYAPYQATIKMMKKHVKDLQDPSIDQEQQQVNSDMLPLLHARLVRQAELMCAYMVYKIKYFDEAEKIIGEQTKLSMLKNHNRYLAHIEEQLNATERDFAAIENILNAYREAIAAQVNHFALTEGETKRDRSIIKKQMKHKN